MTNPYTGVVLNGAYYNYVPGSYNRTYPLKNTPTESQNSRTFSTLGYGFPIHTVTLTLDNMYTPFGLSNNAQLGATTYLGVTRLYDLLNSIGGIGASLPVQFIAPDGSTHLVIPSGMIDVSVFLSEAPQSTGMEYRVNLTLNNVS